MLVNMDEVIPMKRQSFILEQGLYLSFATALTAMLGSLYFSEIKEYMPCTYCWYQRILMYPLVLILGIAAVRKDYIQALYVLPLSLLGMGISTFHYLKQKTNWFAVTNDACGLVPCNIEYINVFGFITIPFLALTAFTLISVLQILIIRASRSS
jgi:disulfide bond formation protein DsbB